MEDLPLAKDLLEALSYIAVLLGIPIGLYQFRKAARREQRDREYGTYNALDEKYLEFLHLCFDNPDLDIFDIPQDPPPTRTPAQRQRELIAFTMLFSLFERAYLMYRDQRSEIIRNQWSGWLDYLYSFCYRPNFRSAWTVSGQTFDLRFQRFVDDILLEIAPSTQSYSWRKGQNRTPRTMESDEFNVYRVRNPLEPEYTQGIQTYAGQILPSLESNSNCIAHLLQEFGENVDRQFFFFTLLREGRAIGVAHFVHLKREGVLVNGLFFIGIGSRGGGALFQYIGLIERHLSEVVGATLPPVVIEFSLREKHGGGFGNRRLIQGRRLLRILGFTEIPFSYSTPCSLYTTEPARMFFRAEQTPITEDAFGDLIETIFLRYHPMWHLAFEGTSRRARRWLRNEVETIRKALSAGKDAVQP